VIETDLLGDRRRGKVEQLARSNGVTCDRCRSAQLWSEERADIGLGGARVTLQCSDCGGRQRLKLSSDEARSVGIDMGTRPLNDTL
jgi:RNase P subunit RPR2